MFPIILLAHKQETYDQFLAEFKQKNDFSELYTQTIVPEKTNVTINQIRDLKKDLKMVSSNPRLIIFQSFDASTNEAQNALLKVLEELNTKNQFIMLASQLGNILPTIISRSQVIHLEEDNLVYDINTVVRIDTFLDTPSITYLSDPIFTVSTKEEAAALLKICIERMRLRIQDSKKIIDVIKKTLELLYKLEHNNLSPQLTVDNWILLVLKSQ